MEAHEARPNGSHLRHLPSLVTPKLRGFFRAYQGHQQTHNEGLFIIDHCLVSLMIVGCLVISLLCASGTNIQNANLIVSCLCDRVEATITTDETSYAMQTHASDIIIVIYIHKSM